MTWLVKMMFMCELFVHRRSRHAQSIKLGSPTVNGDSLTCIHFHEIAEIDNFAWIYIYSRL